MGRVSYNHGRGCPLSPHAMRTDLARKPHVQILGTPLIWAVSSLTNQSSFTYIIKMHGDKKKKKLQKSFNEVEMAVPKSRVGMIEVIRYKGHLSFSPLPPQ